MQVLSVVAQKGGAGKTTLTGHIAVQAELSGVGPVGVLDADPQESLSDWWSERAGDTPIVVQTSLWRLDEDIRHMRDIGVELLLIDTPPGVTTTIRSAIEASDLVLVPARPSPHDLRATGRTVALVKGLGKPLVFVVNGASSRARVTVGAAIALSQHGTLAPVTVHERAEFATSMIDGRTVMEVARTSASALEIAELWAYLERRLSGRYEDTSLRPMMEVA